MGLEFIVEIGQAIAKGIELANSLDNLGKKGNNGSHDPMSDIMSAISDAFESALGACGNEGQVAQIESIGEGGFKQACFESGGEGGAADILASLCPHPEAVDDILGQAGDDLDSAYQDAMDYMASQGDDEAEDD